MCKSGERKDVEKHYGDRLAEQGLATQPPSICQTLLEGQLHGFLTRERNFCKLLKVLFRSPLVLKSIPLAGNKMTLLASFQRD